MVDDAMNAAPQGAGTGTLRQTQESRLLPLVQQAMEDRDLYFDSLLDVGFGSRPLDQWFLRQRRIEAPRRYVGIDQDPKAVEAAVSRNVLAYSGFNAPFDLTSDLVIAADVLEHVAPSSAMSLLKKCASLTTKLFALSTLNARQWSRTGVRRDFGKLKFLPDSVLQCYRPDDDPARIRNVVDAERVHAMMHEAFDNSEWDIEVYEAWPWEIRDLSGDAEFKCYLKTFAIATARTGTGDTQ
jgi:2-polyprenyl-3-methyl-5-hydroxy-6-metoxy-1,4-benzoquinol methylase